jgi:hypothetical protein
MEGIRALEALHEVRISADPVWPADLMRKEAKRLGEALDQTLPPTARRAIVSAVEDEFWAALEREYGDDLEPVEKPFWHHRVPGLGFWYPAWSAIRWDGGHPEVAGEWFIPEVQTDYEAYWQDSESNDGSPPPSQDQIDAGAAPPVDQKPDLRSDVEADRLEDEVHQGSLRPGESALSLDEVRGETGPAQIATPVSDEAFSRMVEQRLKAWCELIGQTPKSLHGETIGRMSEFFAKQVAADIMRHQVT